MKGKSFFLWILLTVMAVMVFQSIGRFSAPMPKNIAYSEFRQDVRDGKVESVKIYQDHIEGDILKLRVLRMPQKVKFQTAVMQKPIGLPLSGWETLLERFQNFWTTTK